MKSSKSLTMLLSDPAENQEEAEAEEEDEGKTSDFLFTFKDVGLFYYPAHVALPTQNEVWNLSLVQSSSKQLNLPVCARLLKRTNLCCSALTLTAQHSAHLMKNTVKLNIQHDIIQCDSVT